MPFEIVAVPSDLLLYLSPNCTFIVIEPYVLPVCIDNARPGGRYYRIHSIAIDVFGTRLS